MTILTVLALTFVTNVVFCLCALQSMQRRRSARHA